MSRNAIPKFGALVAVLLALSACAPAAPSPTAAPPKPAPTTAPAKPTEAPAAKPAEAKPAAPPAAKPAEAKPAASPAAKPAEAKPAASPAAKPAAKFDAKAIEEFYRGKTIRLIVGTTPGGGFAAYSQAIGRHISRYIPGQPTIVVEFMPGGSSVPLANQLYSSLPKDGTVIGMLVGPIILEQLFKTPGVEFDMGKYRHLAVPVTESYVFFVHKRTGVTKLDDLMGPNAKEVAVGAIANSTPEHAPILVRDLLGGKIKLVSGYGGTAPVRLAMESGEVDGLFNTWQSSKVTHLDKIQDGTHVPLAIMSDKLPADMPFKVPTIPEFTKTEEQKQLFLFGTSHPNQFGKLYVAPPETPLDRVAALDEAFARVFTDKEFLADATKANLEINPLRGAEITKLTTDMVGTSDAIKAKLKQAMRGGS